MLRRLVDNHSSLAAFLASALLLGSFLLADGIQHVLFDYHYPAWFHEFACLGLAPTCLMGAFGINIFIELIRSSRRHRK